MKLLVTGGLGHIGSALIRDWPGRYGDEVTVLDSLLTQRYCSLFDLPRPVRLVEGDVRGPSLDGLVQAADVVIHLAALTDAANSVGREAEYEAVNVGATRMVAEACWRHEVPLVFPSTTSVYGSQRGTVDETLPLTQYAPASPYAASKLVAEEVLENLALLPGQPLRVAVLRFGTIYGMSAGWRNHTAANRFCWQATHGQPITVYRDSWEQRRPYLDLGDCLKAMRWVIDGDRFDGSVRNVVTGNHTVREVVECIEAWVGPVAIERVDSPLLNQLSFEVSARKIQEEGFTFEGDLEKGLRGTLRTLGAGIV